MTVIKTSGRELSEEEDAAQRITQVSIAKHGQTYWAKVKGFNVGAEKPLTVERTYRDKTYTIDCYVTTQIKDEYQAGTLQVGDFVLVSFIDGDPDKTCAILKVYKTW